MPLLLQNSLLSKEFVIKQFLYLKLYIYKLYIYIYIIYIYNLLEFHILSKNFFFRELVNLSWEFGIALILEEPQILWGKKEIDRNKYTKQVNIQ